MNSCNDPIPFFIVGDDSFPLKPYLLKPYPAKRMGDMASMEQERRAERIFNYRLSRARRISENVFGILAARFGVFRVAIHLSPDNAVIITKACLALHNFCQRQRDKHFVPLSLVDQENPVSHEMIPGEYKQSPCQYNPAVWKQKCSKCTLGERQGERICQWGRKSFLARVFSIWE